MPSAMEAEQQAVEPDGCYPPGDRFLNIDHEPIVWQRVDPCAEMDYISINELVSQNNLRLAEYYARILASGGDIGDVRLRSIEECVNDARHAFYVAEHVRDCKETAEPRNTPAGISFGDRRRAQAARNRAAYFAASSIIDLAEHTSDELLQIDSVEWLRSIRKPLPPPPPHPGTPIIPGEFTKFPVLGPRASPKKRQSLPPMEDAVTTPVKPSPSRHRRNQASMDSPGFYIPAAQFTRSTSEVAGLGMRSAPRPVNPGFSFPALPRVGEATSAASDVFIGTASPKHPVQNTTDTPKRYGTWADLEHNIPKSISIPNLSMTPMTPRQRMMLEDYRASTTKKQYIPLAERDTTAKKQKVPTHVMLARSRADGFSPKKRLDTESMPSMFTPKKQMATPARQRKNSVDLNWTFPTPSKPSTPSKKSSSAEPFTPTKMSSHSRQQLSIDGQSKQDMGPPPKFYTHKRNNGMSKSSPQPRDFQSGRLDDCNKENKHLRSLSQDTMYPMEMLDDRSSKDSSFAYNQEHEKALMAGGYIPQPPPVPKKSPLRDYHTNQSQYDEHRLKRVESQRNLSPKKTVTSEIQHNPSPQKKESTDTIGRRNGHRMVKSATSFNLNNTATVAAPVMQRSETVPGNLQEASANVLDVADESDVRIMTWGERERAAAKAFEVEQSYREVAARDARIAAQWKPLSKAEKAKLGPSAQLAYEIMERDYSPRPTKKDSSKAKKDTSKATKLSPAEQLALETANKKDASKPKKLVKMNSIAEGDDNPSTSRVVDSMQMFNHSFWNRDSTSSPSRKDRAASPTKAETTKVKTEKNKTEKDKEKKESTFEEKKPFLRAMWENMSRKVHKSKPCVPSISVTGVNSLAPSSFMISCEPSFQATLYAQLELLLSTLTNRFLMEEYNASRITRKQATSYVARWVCMGRAQFTEFNCGQTFQALIVWELRDQLMFFGTYDQRLRDATVSTWLVNAKEMGVKTGCIGDSAMQKHLQDSWKVLELLGGSWEDFEALSKLHVGFHDEVAKAKERNDAAGVPHEWNPEPVPKTPAVGTLIRTPMLK